MIGVPVCRPYANALNSQVYMCKGDKHIHFQIQFPLCGNQINVCDVRFKCDGDERSWDG